MKRDYCWRCRDFFSPGSLRIQLLSRSLLVLAVLLILVGIFQYIFMRDIIYKNKAVNLQSQIMSIPPPAWEKLGGNLKEDSMGPPRIFIPEATVAFIDINGNYKVLSDGPDDRAVPRLGKQKYLDLIKERHRLNYMIVDEEEEQLTVFQPIRGIPGQEIGLVQISTPTGPLQELLLHQLLMFLLLSLLALLCGWLAYLPVLKRTLDPLSNMVDAAEQIDAGNLDKRFPTQQGQEEIDRLAESCNGMLERLEDSFTAERETKEQMRRFVADASHELRTPLTSIYGFLEVLLRGAVNQPDKLNKALVSMHSESQRLNKLVNDLLLLTKLDSKPNIELAEGCLDKVINDMKAQLCILAGERQVLFNIESDVKCKCDEDQMKQVVLNLFQNAVQHTDPNIGHIQISVKKDNEGVLMSIQDDGPGINGDHLPHVFERFYRSDTARTRKHGGTGLGLAITKSIVEVHGGKITAANQDSCGCVFRVWLPL